MEWEHLGPGFYFLELFALHLQLYDRCPQVPERLLSGSSHKDKYPTNEARLQNAKKKWRETGRRKDRVY